MITVVNGVEIWFIANRYRRTVNPLLVFVKTLSIVDLLIGVNFFVRVSSMSLFTSSTVFDIWGAGGTWPPAGKLAGTKNWSRSKALAFGTFSFI